MDWFSFIPLKHSNLKSKQAAAGCTFEQNAFSLNFLKAMSHSFRKGLYVMLLSLNSIIFLSFPSIPKMTSLIPSPHVYICLLRFLYMLNTCFQICWFMFSARSAIPEYIMCIRTINMHAWPMT